MAIAWIRYPTLLLLLAAAGISYVVGFAAGVGIFVVLGVIFELSFWIGLFKPRR
jgi:hypothetical protein